MILTEKELAVTARKINDAYISGLTYNLAIMYNTLRGLRLYFGELSKVVKMGAEGKFDPVKANTVTNVDLGSVAQIMWYAESWFAEADKEFLEVTESYDTLAKENGDVIPSFVPFMELYITSVKTRNGIT